MFVDRRCTGAHLYTYAIVYVCVCVCVKFENTGVCVCMLYTYQIHTVYIIGATAFNTGVDV